MVAQSKILICDDDAQLVRLLARQARALGWVAVAETSSVAVFPLALKHRPDLIVLDVHQLIDGRDLLTKLRRDVRTSGIRVVMMSGSDLPGLRSECLTLGADAFVAKPFEFEELLPAPELPEFDLHWEETPAPRQSPIPKLENWSEIPYSKATLLFADDSKEMINALVRGAKAEGFTALSDTTSDDVLTLARIHHPDVIVLDVNQKIDGRHLLADLKRDPQTRDIKVVMLSGNEDPRTRHECLDLGAEDYFTKPLDALFFQRLGELAGIGRAA